MPYVLMLQREGEPAKYWCQECFSQNYIYASIYSSRKTALTAKRRIVDKYYLGKPEHIKLVEIDLNPYG